MKIFTAGSLISALLLSLTAVTAQAGNPDAGNDATTDQNPAIQQAPIVETAPEAPAPEVKPAEGGDDKAVEGSDDKAVDVDATATDSKADDKTATTEEVAKDGDSAEK